MANRVHTDGPVSGANGDPSDGVRGFSNLTYHYDQLDTGSEVAEDQVQAIQFSPPAARIEQQPGPGGPTSFQLLPPPYTQQAPGQPQTPLQYNNVQQPGPPSYTRQPGMLPYNQQNAPPPGQSNSPGFVYPPGAPYGPPPIQYPVRPPPQQQQQQQQQLVIINSQVQPQYVEYQPTQSFCCHITLSCFVFWLFLNPLFGIIAFILAAVGSSLAVSDRKRARQLGRASYGVSVAGIIVTVVIIGILAAVFILDNKVNNEAARAATTTTTTTTPDRCLYYNNYFCYPYTLNMAGTECAFGVSNSGKCYYDTMYSCSSDSTDADHDTRGNCYKVSTTRCQYAVNYNNGVCYKYVLNAKPSETCHATYIRYLNDGSKYCYYTKRDQYTSMLCTLYYSGDASNDGYCYHN